MSRYLFYNFTYFSCPGSRFCGLSTPPWPLGSCSVLVSVTLEDTVESNLSPLTEEGRPVFREEMAFRMTKDEMVNYMVSKEAVDIKVKTPLYCNVYI